jgi:tetratricopeptide (TPR) repeat protein
MLGFGSFAGMMSAAVIVGMVSGTTVSVAADSTENLGKIDFPASGSPEAHHLFLRGVAALHSFWYEEAINAFRRSTAKDPDLVMGYWGEAMAHHHPIWEEENLEAARAVLKKVPDGAPLTDREHRYLDAVRRLFGEGDKLSRHRGYADQMERLHRDYPEDQDAACLYALSLLGLATHFDGQPAVRDKYRMQAGALGLEVYGKNPDHPCGAHYTIHAFDDPVHAILALPQARRYAEIAPAVPHAQHMPAHIFLQLGMWQEAAASSKAGWESSADWVRRDGLPLALQDYHSLYWLHYVYLQQGRYGEAETLLRIKQRDMAESQPSDVTRLHGFERTVSRNYDRMIAAYIVETERWEAMHQPWDVEGYQFGEESPELAAYVRALADQMGALQGQMGTQAKGRRSAPSPPASRSEDMAFSGGPELSRIWDLQLAALSQVEEKNFSKAGDLMEQAIALENTLPPPSGPPVLIKPSHERYGEILLRAGRHNEARRQFEQALFWHPNRARSLLGLARAAAESGDARAARDGYTTFLSVWKQAEPDHPEVNEAKQFLRNEGN